MPKNLQLLNALNGGSANTASKPSPMLPLPPLQSSKPVQLASEKSVNFKQNLDSSHHMSELFEGSPKTVQEQNNLASHFLKGNVKSKHSSYSPLHNEPKPKQNHLVSKPGRLYIEYTRNFILISFEGAENTFK